MIKQLSRCVWMVFLLSCTALEDPESAERAAEFMADLESVADTYPFLNDQPGTAATCQGTLCGPGGLCCTAGAPNYSPTCWQNAAGTYKCSYCVYTNALGVLSGANYTWCSQHCTDNEPPSEGEGDPAGDGFCESTY